MLIVTLEIHYKSEYIKGAIHIYKDYRTLLDKAPWQGDRLIIP
jgi:hypothetical protein